MVSVNCNKTMCTKSTCSGPSKTATSSSPELVNVSGDEAEENGGCYGIKVANQLTSQEGGVYTSQASPG